MVLHLLKEGRLDVSHPGEELEMISTCSPEEPACGGSIISLCSAEKQSFVEIIVSFSSEVPVWEGLETSCSEELVQGGLEVVLCLPFSCLGIKEDGSVIIFLHLYLEWSASEVVCLRFPRDGAGED